MYREGQGTKVKGEMSKRIVRKERKEKKMKGKYGSHKLEGKIGREIAG